MGQKHTGVIISHTVCFENIRQICCLAKEVKQEVKINLTLLKLVHPTMEAPIFDAVL